MGKVFVGHDWAEAHHDVYAEDEDARRLVKARLPEGVEGVRRFHELVSSLAKDSADVVVATETDRGLFVGALVAAGYQVIAVNPMSTSRYGSATRRREPSPIPATPGCCPSWPAPTPTTTARSPGTVSWPRRSRSWPGPTSR